jgi:4-carboxymuconolactone decarboxylase
MIDDVIAELEKLGNDGVQALPLLASRGMHWSWLKSHSRSTDNLNICERVNISDLISSKDLLVSTLDTPPNPGSATATTPNMSSDPKYDELHKQLFEEGLKMRRSVVGDEYVNRALENGSTEFSRAGQELVTEMCWGYAWTRPGLDKKQRSLINIGMLMALNRAPELAVHVRGARNNGLSELEIREAIIHATTYCGVPAGVDAMKTAEKVLNEMAEKGEMPRELGNRSERA